MAAREASSGAPGILTGERSGPLGRLAARLTGRGAAVTVTRLALAAAFLLFWEAAVTLKWADPFFVSSPSRVWAVLVEQFSTGRIYPHLWVTLQESAAGLLLGFLAGAVLGWIAAQHRFIGELVQPVMLLLNSVPRIVLGPMIILVMGIGPGSKIALSFLMVFVVIFFAVYSGIKEVDPNLIERVVLLGGGQTDILRYVYIPSVLAWVFASLRLTVGFAFTGAIVGEYIASSRGLGYLLNLAGNTQNMSLMLAAVAVVMGMILALFAVLERIEARATAWKQG